MSNANVIEQPALYRPDVVETFRQAADKEVQRLADEATKLQEQVNDLTAQIRDRQQQISQYRQVMSMVTAHEDLPIPPTCRTCGKGIVSDNGTWRHEERRTNPLSDLCNPDDKNSPRAEPAKGVGQAFGDWSNAIKEDRAGGHS